ncbi:MAG TPA: TraB/GumN family protein, partial [Steroidobacteraceae bacterium]
RWLALRDNYLGGNYDEHTRPLLAALDLFQHAVDQAGLTSTEDVWRLVAKTAYGRHVPVAHVTIKLRFDNPIAWIQEFNQIPPEQEVDCLKRTIERIETDLQPMRQRANLWSVGDIDGLRAMRYPDDRVTCFNALFSVRRMHDQLSRAEAQLNDAWLTAADNALNKNASSFAVLPLGELLKPDGWLSKLRAKGYVIKDP